MEDETHSICAFHHAIEAWRPRFTFTRKSKLIKQFRQIPRTSEARLQESLSDEEVDTFQRRNDESKKEETYLYLGYGSNMCALTFLNRRGIRPLSQLNVVVPEIRLTFGLSGIPYSEPCFGNTEYRDIESSAEKEKIHTADYHKDRWHKGLVGVVYEVTGPDYAHIIATEGGGAAYQDVLVDCYPLSTDPSEPVPLHPTGPSFKAHTLYAPGRVSRADPAYAQPSPRYLKLLTDGGLEHDLPTEYRQYLSQIRTYTTSTVAQQLGAFVFTMLWGPFLMFMFTGGGRIFLRPDGTYPKWYARMAGAIFVGMWASYDNYFKPLFGDGERTIEDGGNKPDYGEEKRVEAVDKITMTEKTPLLVKNASTTEWSEPGTQRGDEMV